MKILILGGTGLISTAVTTELSKKEGIELFMINRGNRINNIPKNVQYFRSDIGDIQKINLLTKGLYFDAVIDFIYYDDAKNIENTIDVFAKKTKQYIFISSVAAYLCVEKNKGAVIDEDLLDKNTGEIKNATRHGMHKYLCEEYLKRKALSKNIYYTIVRPHYTYSNSWIPYGDISGNNGRLPFDRIKNQKPMITWNQGVNRHNMIHIDDFAIAIAGLLGNELAYNESFNIVGDETPSWKEILDIISNLLETELKTIDIPLEYYLKEMDHDKKNTFLLSCANDIICSNQKLKSAVADFKQNILIKDGIKLALENYKNITDSYIGYSWDGDYDRIIAKYASKNNISKKYLNLKYIEYSSYSQNRIKNLLLYFVFRMMPPTFRQPLRVIKKILRILGILK
jgi:nucleoside-diphosphate-sugar epimerase